MKKAFAVLLIVAVFVPVIACAEGVFVDGWETSSIDSLIQAKEALSKQITQLITRQYASSEGISFSGEGLSITDGYTLPAGIWKRTISVPNASLFEDKVTFTKGGSNTTVTLGDATLVTPIQISGSVDVDYAVVETSGAWTISYAPIKDDGSITANGNGGFVGDFFTCEKPTIVIFQVRNGHGSLTNFQVYLYSLSTSGRLSSEYSAELMVNGLLNTGDSETFQAIIKPEDKNAAYLWVIETDDGVEWSITTK